MFRDARRQISRQISYSATLMAPRLPEGAVSAAERLLSAIGPNVPVLGRMVEENLRSAGLYSSRVLRDYFDQVAHHFASALRIFRHVGNPSASERLARREISLHPSTEILPSLLQTAGGLVIAAPHVCSYVLTMVRLNQIVRVVDYQRYSEDERNRAVKERFCQGAGLEFIREPRSAADPTSRAMACVEAVRNGRALVLTPDLAQKEDRGVPVRFLGRTVFLPTGPAAIAMLANVPLVPMFGRIVDGVHEVYATEPIEVPAFKRSEGGRPAALRWATQAWADRCETFIREQPHLWFFWGDKGWTRVFHGDPRYVRPLGEAVAANPVASGAVL